MSAWVGTHVYNKYDIYKVRQKQKKRVYTYKHTEEKKRGVAKCFINATLTQFTQKYCFSSCPWHYDFIHPVRR